MGRPAPPDETHTALDSDAKYLGMGLFNAAGGPARSGLVTRKESHVRY